MEGKKKKSPFSQEHSWKETLGARKFLEQQSWSKAILLEGELHGHLYLTMCHEENQTYMLILPHELSPSVCVCVKSGLRTRRANADKSIVSS